MITIEMTIKYLNFLLGEIERYKEDWELENEEFRVFLIELKRFKQLIKESYHIPYDIKTEIANLKLVFNDEETVHQKLLDDILYDQITSYKILQLKRRKIFDNFGKELKKILLKIDTFQSRSR